MGVVEYRIGHDGTYENTQLRLPQSRRLGTAATPTEESSERPRTTEMSKENGTLGTRLARV